MPDDVQYIKLPDGSYGKFRSTANDDDIQSAISKDFPTAYAPQKSTAPTTPGSGKITGISAPATPEQMIKGQASYIAQHPWKTFFLGLPAGTMDAPSPTSNPVLAMGSMGEAAGALPSTQRAGMAFQKIAKVAGESPVQITEDLSNSANRIYDLSQRGNTMPKVVRDFLKRTTSPDLPPITYNEARDFYSKATSLTPDEATKLSGQVKFALRQFTGDLGNSINATADSVGQGQKLSQAMNEYRRASNIKSLGTKVTKTLPYVGGAAATYEAVKRLK